jgi:hypothetical protein
MNDQFESNYALLVRSEEKGRGVLEILVYATFFLSVVSSIWQFAQTPLKISAHGDETAASVLLAADMLGNIRTQTTRAFTASEMEQILSRVP